MDKVRNNEVRRRADLDRELESRVDQRVLRWFGQVARMDDLKTRRALMADVSQRRVRGRPKLCWMDDVKVAICSRGMPVEAAQQDSRDRKEWRALMHM